MFIKVNNCLTLLHGMKLTYTRLLLVTVFSLLSFGIKAQKLDVMTKIMGTVSDAVTKEPLPFVNIVFKGTVTGTSSADDGTYSLETRKPTDSLMFSFMGFETLIVKIDKGKFQKLSVELMPLNLNLQEVVIVAGENPAEIILRKVIENKPVNNIEKYNFYQYEAYNKMQVDANNLTSKAVDRKIYKPFSFIFEHIDTSTLNGKTYLPVFITEIISDVYYRKEYKTTREVIKASKVSGFEKPGIVQFLGDKFVNYNIYDNYILLFQKNFVSPVADFGLLFYRYYLTDSAYLDGKWCRKIVFKPRRNQELTFSGSIWITDTTFAVKELEMRMASDANINFVNDFYLSRVYNHIENKHWMVTRDHMIGDFNLIEGSKLMGIFGHKTSTYRNFNFDKPENERIFAAPIQVLVKEDAHEKTDEYWNENRHEALTRDQMTIYEMVDTLRKIPLFRTYVDIVQTIGTGYYEFDKYEIGPYMSLLSFNDLEGIRLRFGGRTLLDFSKRFRLIGHVAYGTFDQQIKYQGGFEYYKNKYPLRKFAISHKYDIEQLGSSVNSFRVDFLLAALLRRNPVDKISMVRENKAWYQHEWFTGLSNSLSFIQRTVYSSKSGPFMIFPEPYNPEEISEVTTSELKLDTRIAIREKFVLGDFDRYPISNPLPVVELQYGYGIPALLHSDFEYHRLTIRVSQWFNLLALGWSKYIFEAGRLWGTLPYPLLKLHEGNETYFFDEYSFNMMNYYEFVSDKFVSLYYTHNFEGLFFNRVPLFRKLKMREVVFGKGLIGGLDAKNKTYSKFPEGMYVFDKPYFEAGVGIANILKIGRIDYIWRLSYLDHANIAKSGLRVSLRFDF